MNARAALLLLCLLLVASVRAINVVNVTNNLTATALTDQYLVLVNASAPAMPALLNATSVPTWERLDTSLPHATLIVADDFAIPAAVLDCKELVVDVPLLMTMASGAGYRAPTLATLYLLPPAGVALNTTFNTSTLLTVELFTTPSEGNWTALGDTGGVTVDQGGARHMHIETFRFRAVNVTLAGGQTYWVALVIAQDRAFNTSDYSQNQPRWLTAASGGSGSEYRVVDRYGSFVPTAPQLVRWTNASRAEPSVLPFWPSGPIVSSSGSRQLAFALYTGQCRNMSALNMSTTRMVSSLPTQRTNLTLVVPAPTPTPTPTPVVVVSVPTPTPTTNVTVVTTPTPIQPPVVVVTPVPTPVVIVSTPSPTAAMNSTTPQPTVEPSSNSTMFIVFGVGGLLLLVLVVVVLYVVARRLRPNFVNMSYAELVKQEDDTTAIRLDDMNEDDDSREDPKPPPPAPAKQPEPEEEGSIRLTYKDKPDDDESDASEYDKNTMLPVKL